MHKIGIHSVPRSGSTWLGEIFNSSPVTKYCFQPLFSYKFKDYLSLNSTLPNIENFFNLLAKDSDDFIGQNSERKSGQLPVFKKDTNLTHVIYKEVRYNHLIEHMLQTHNDMKFVLLIRNPIQVINSWYMAPREFNPSWDIENELMLAPSKNLGKVENSFGLAAWIQTAKLFEEMSYKHPSRVSLVNYLNLADETNSITHSLFKFASIPFEDQTLRFLDESRNRIVNSDYSVFRGKNKSEITLPIKVLNQIESEVINAGLTKYLQDYV